MQCRANSGNHADCADYLTYRCARAERAIDAYSAARGNANCRAGDERAIDSFGLDDLSSRQYAHGLCTEST